MADFMQIIDVNESGVERVLHPETNADFVVSGTVYKVPKIMEITDWNLRSQELVEARKGKATLKLKIDEIDTALIPTNLLETIKGVDGSGSGLDADMVDGRTVDDTSNSGLNLWTAAKVVSELAKKFDNTEVVTAATANKVLRLNSNGLLPTGITGNAATATKLQTPLKVDFTGDVSGTISFSGNEASKTVDLQIINNSHSHNNLTGTSTFLDSLGGVNITSFRANGVEKSFIGLDGSFSGSAAMVKGVTVDNQKDNSIWTGDRVRAVSTEIAVAESQKVVEAELGEYAKRVEGGIYIGPILYTHGQIDISGVTTVEIPLPFEAAEFIGENYVIVSSDATLTLIKDETSTNSLIKLKLNKYAPFGTKINWYITSI